MLLHDHGEPPPLEIEGDFPAFAIGTEIKVISVQNGGIDCVLGSCLIRAVEIGKQQHALRGVV